ncbi:MAG: hypothetical protein ABIN13_14655 [Mucilaginibacter sp.]
MRRFFLIIICLLLLSGFAHAQDTQTTKQVFSPDFNWRLTIPDGFESLTAEQFAKLQQRGTDALEKSSGSKIENNTKKICSFKNGTANYFEANGQPFDAATDGDYLTTCRGVNDLLYRTFKEQVPKGTQIDTTFAKEVVAGLQFERFEMKIKLGPAATLTMLMYSRLFEKKEFTATIAYVEKEKGDLILAAWRNSKFANQ